MNRRTITLTDDLDDRVAERLEYGDNFSEMAREALIDYLDKTEKPEA